MIRNRRWSRMRAACSSTWLSKTVLCSHQAVNRMAIPGWGCGHFMSWTTLLLFSFHPARSSSTGHQLFSYTAFSSTHSEKRQLHYTLASAMTEHGWKRLSIKYLASQVPVMQLLPAPILWVIRGVDSISSFLCGEDTQARFFWSPLNKHGSFSSTSLASLFLLEFLLHESWCPWLYPLSHLKSHQSPVQYINTSFTLQPNWGASTVFKVFFQLLL